MRSFSRLGSQLSVFGVTRVASLVSVSALSSAGSALTARSSAWLSTAVASSRVLREGCSVSVLNMLHLGSCLSLRAFRRVGAALSLWGSARLGASFSLLGCSHMGATLAMRQMMRVGQTFSVQGRPEGVSNVPPVVYTDLSCGTFVRMGSSLSLYGSARFSSALSVLDMAILGSSLSIRSSLRCGSHFSVLDFSLLGASLALRSVARAGPVVLSLGYCALGSKLSIDDRMNIKEERKAVFEGGEITYKTSASSIHVNMWGASPSPVFTPLKITPTGGIFEGAWQTENVVSSSDRRLKEDVRPLRRSLPGAGRAEGASGVLRALRPTAFAFGGGPGVDAPRPRRYGFIAQEVGRVLPGATRQTEAGTRAVAYDDLLAVITLASQEMQRRLDGYQAQEEAEEALMRRQDDLIETMERRISELQRRFARVE